VPPPATKSVGRSYLPAPPDDTHSPWTESRLLLTLCTMGKAVDILERFGQRVRELRRAEGLSQEAFAAKCGLDRTYMGGIERGERNLALRNINLIAETLEMSLSELMRGL
jgi:ribosome-binding protein aMBF1 (putative translation factor)